MVSFYLRYFVLSCSLLFWARPHLVSAQTPACPQGPLQLPARVTITAGDSATLHVRAPVAALDFDGVADQLAFPTPSGASTPLPNVVNTFTVEAWVRPTAPHEIDPQTTNGIGGVYNERYLIFPQHGEVWGPGHAGMGISVGTNGVSVYEHAANYMPAVLVWTGALTDWTHLAVVYRAGRPTLFINGDSVRQGEQSPMSYVHASLNLGGYAYGFFQGQLAEVHYWNEARSAATLRATYRQTLPTVTGPLLAAWHLDEGSGSTVTDLGPGQYVGTLTRSGGPAGRSGPQWVVPSTAPLSPVLSYQWSPATGLSATQGAQVQASPPTTTTYTVTASVGGSCAPLTRTVTVVVQPAAVAGTRNLPDDTNQGLALAHPHQPADSAAPKPADMNYVRVWTPRVALTRAGRVAPAPVDSVAMSTQYLDGLGRPVQTVLHQASPQKRDLVQPQAYDGLGREPRQYLPYPDSVGGRGGYRYRALTQQQDFYARTGLAGGGQGPPTPSDATLGVARTGVAFAETRFEASPLNRVLAQGAAGEAWQLGAGHAPQRLERPNTAQDSVPRFAPGYSSRSLDPGYQGFYAAGELWGEQTIDEHGGRSLAWKDKLGQVVLKQLEVSHPDTSRTAPRRWLRTAYVYDDFQHLRFVLQPEATKRVLALHSTTPVPLPVGALPFLFHYRYDGRGRQIAKQVPGQDDETLVVYDQLDRPVLSQDASQRTRKEWSWTKYDALGRLVLSGLVTRPDTAGQVTLQAVATADTATAHQYEQRTSDLNQYPQHYTTDHAFPQLGQQGFGAGQVLSVTYYDDYDYDTDGVPDVTYDTQLDGYFTSGQAPVPDALRTMGLVTGTQTRVLGVATSDQYQQPWLRTTTFYDERARPVQVQSLTARKDPNGEPLRELLTTQLDFTGQVVQSVARHEGLNHAPVLVAEYFTYDHVGRVRTTRQQVLGADPQPALLSRRHYNELGQLAIDSLGTGRLAQQLKYAYNIRGWLTKLNDPAQPLAGDLFNLSLHYETGFTKGYEQYNGNLTGQTWRGRDGVQRAYGYAYDAPNRLLQGDFVARAGGSTGTLATATAWNQELDHYRLNSVSYDDNGNINTLRRRGLRQNATHNAAKQYGAVDDLSYAYVGNRLQVVDDQVTGNQLAKPASYHGAPTSLAGDFQEAGVQQSLEYLYDANGNLTQDKNKGITGIAYNHLNLPRQIHFGQVGDSVVFRYTAAGQKVAKLVYQTGQSKPQRTDYLGPYQYEQDSLKFFPHAEGRVLRFVSYDPAGQSTVSYQREYTLKDHLGNLRLAYRLGQVRTLTATLEQDIATHKRESQQFDSASVSPPVAQQVGGLARTGSYVARLNAGGSAPQPLGPLTQLAVQKGDTISVTAPGMYPQAVNNNSFLFSLASFVTSLLQPPPAGTPASADGRKRGALPLLQIGLGAGIAALPQLSGGVPKGYLRVLFFNRDSVLVSQRTVQLSQAALNSYEPLHLDTLAVRQDGYVTVYVGNESAVDVLFDDIQLTHRQGLLVQETQYDPAGLELAGLAAPSPGIRGLNNYRFNGKEFQVDLGLNWNHQDARFFDSQILRWHVVDPEIENGQESWTPYSFGYNNAVRYADANGRWPGEGFFTDAKKFIANATENVNTAYVNAKRQFQRFSENKGEHQFINGNSYLTTAKIASVSGTGKRVASAAGVDKKGDREKEGSNTNALRHAYGQALATAAVGYKVAREAGDAHEDTKAGVLDDYADEVTELRTNGIVGVPRAIADNFVDQLNNETGRQISVNNPYASVTQLAVKSLSALKNGQLYGFTGNGPTVYVMPTSLSQSVYLQASKNIQEAAKKDSGSLTGVY